MKNVYLVTNRINGKQYIGKTKQDIQTRLQQHKWCNHDTLLHLAIKEYGIDNFSIELLETVEDNIALDKEKEYTIMYNTLSPNGYNQMIGQSLKGGNNKMKGKHLSVEWRKHCARPGEINGRASLYKLIWIDTKEEIIFKTRAELKRYLGYSLNTIKKWMNKEHIDYNTQRPVIYYNIGRINNVRKN